MLDRHPIRLDRHPIRLDRHPIAKVTKGLIKVTKGFAKVTKGLIKVTKGFAKVRNGKLIDMFKERYCIDGVETHCIIEAICCGTFAITFCNYPLINVVGKIWH